MIIGNEKKYYLFLSLEVAEKKFSSEIFITINTIPPAIFVFCFKLFAVFKISRNSASEVG